MYYIVIYYLLVVVHDGVDSVCDGQHRTVSELAAYCRLDQIIGLRVDGRRRLIKDQHLGLTEQRTSQAHQLLLTHTAHHTTSWSFNTFMCVPL